MMAFFLLMWLLNATSDDQRRGLADYFAPVQRARPQRHRLRRALRRQQPNSDGAMVSDNGAIGWNRAAPRCASTSRMTAPSDAPPETAAPQPPQPPGEAAPQAFRRRRRRRHRAIR